MTTGSWEGREQGRATSWCTWKQSGRRIDRGRLLQVDESVKREKRDRIDTRTYKRATCSVRVAEERREKRMTTREEMTAPVRLIDP